MLDGIWVWRRAVVSRRITRAVTVVASQGKAMFR